MPVNHYYCEEDGKIYFHGAKAGHKIDAIKACDKASYCVYNDGFQRDGEWALNITSVITFGRIHLVEDDEVALKICSAVAYALSIIAFTSSSITPAVSSE